MSMHNLAYTWESQDQNEEAIDLMKQVERLWREQLGPNYPNTMLSTRALYKWQRALKAAGDVTIDDELDSDKDMPIGHSDSGAHIESLS